jgi:hypothetical protein
MEPVTLITAMRATVPPGARVDICLALPAGSKTLRGLTFDTNGAGALVQGKLWTQANLTPADDEDAGSLPLLGTGQAVTIVASARPNALPLCLPLPPGHDALCAELCNGTLGALTIGYTFTIDRN